ncbi:MAG: CAP domain-containing protein [Chloroflexota bacterium]|nr:CAP domain-containing protein [Chloroflexota bacterium]
MGRWLESRAKISLIFALLGTLALGATLAHEQASATLLADPTPTPTPMYYGGGFFLPDGRSGIVQWAERGGPPQDVLITSAEDIEQTIVELTNQRRDEHGLPPLKVCPMLTTAARGHSQDMSTMDSPWHTGSDGSTPCERMTAAGYDHDYCGENIAWGFTSPEAAMDFWYNETPPNDWHRRNILNPDYREFGVGYYYSGARYYHYYTQDFGRRDDVYPVVIEREAAETNSREVSLYTYGTGWANEMMLSNNADFSGAQWEPFAADKQWALSCDNGLKTVYAKIRDVNETVRGPVSDTITLAASDPHHLAVSNSTAAFLYGQDTGQLIPSELQITVSNAGLGCSLPWQAEVTVESGDWLSVSPTSGDAGDDGSTITVQATGFDTTTVGIHHGVITITASTASNSPLTIPVQVLVVEHVHTAFLPLNFRDY